MVEAALSPEPVPVKHLARATGQPPEQLVNSLITEYDRHDHGVRVRLVAGGYTIGTKAELGAELRQVVDGLRLPNRCRSRPWKRRPS